MNKKDLEKYTITEPYTGPFIGYMIDRELTGGDCIRRDFLVVECFQSWLKSEGKAIVEIHDGDTKKL